MRSRQVVTMLALATATMELTLPQRAAANEPPKRTELQKVEQTAGFVYENGAPVGVGRPTYSPAEGKKLYEVVGNFVFPKTNEWNLVDIQIEMTDGSKYTPTAINYNVIYFLAREGAFASVWDDGNVNPVFGLPVTPNEVKFLGQWKGGPAKLKLIFEVPKSVEPKRLHHATSAIDLPLPKGAN